MNGRLTANFITLGVLLAAQAVFLFVLPGRLLVTFTRMRPLLYAAVVIVHFVWLGRDERPVPKAGEAALLGGIGAIFYFTAVLITGVLFGFGKNIMTPDYRAVMNNIWVYAIVALLSEVLRLRLIKTTPADYRSVIAVVLTLVYTFAQLDALRGFLNASFSRNVETFFVSVLPALTLNAVLSYVAYEGSIRALLFIRGAYSLGPVFMPIVPNISNSVWAAVSCGLLLVTAIFYHRNMSKRSRRFRHIAKRRAKYQKKSVPAFIINIAVVAFVIAFTMRAFTYYPVVVLTGSMTGVIDRGSIVFVERLASEDVFGTISEGDIIHYKDKNIEMMHRVIAFKYNSSGERVYITKGDANPIADVSPVEMDRVLGVSRTRIPYIGYPFVIVSAIFGR